MGVGTLKREGIRALPRELPGLVEGFHRHDLLLFASAIAFQVTTAVVPLALFGFGLLGFLDLTEVWRRDLRPDVVEPLSPAARTVLDDTVGRVLGQKQLWWVTAGALLAAWQLSGAVRAVMDALNRVHGAEETRSMGRRYGRSLILAAVLAALVLAAVAVVVLGRGLLAAPGPYLGPLATIGRWAVAAVLVMLAVGLVVRHGPAEPQPIEWVSVGTLLVVGSWLGMSALFGFYLTQFADYGSVFGNLATVVVLLGYLYASAVTFLAGIQMDALLRERHAGDDG